MIESESEVAQSCPTLCYSVDCSPPGSSVHGIFQARILEWVAIYARNLLLKIEKLYILFIYIYIIYNIYIYIYIYSMHAKTLQSCPTLCDPMECSLPGSSVRGILQARILEWVTISFSRGTSQPRDQTHVSRVSCTGRWVLYHYSHLGSPIQSQYLKCSGFK